MSDRRRAPNKFDFPPGEDEGVSIARRKTSFLPGDVYLFEDELEVKGSLTARVVTCEAWLLELYELTAGEIFFLSDGAPVRPATKRFGLFYPPFTISQPCFSEMKGHLVGVASIEPLPHGSPTAPVLFETRRVERPTGVARVLEILNSGTGAQPVEMSPNPSLLSLRAKRLIDENYLIHPSIARIAARLKVTHAHLSRQFKRDFGLSPSAYLGLLRVADAPLRLALGEEIINVSQAVGYNDLSRFYKQFRKNTKTSPGVCRTLMKPDRA